MPLAPQRWSQYFRDEWIDPALDEFLGRYPPGHRYHQQSVLLRYFPLALTLGGLAALVYGLVG